MQQKIQTREIGTPPPRKKYAPRGLYPSLRARSHAAVWFTTEIELDLLYLMDFCADVLDITNAPLTVTYQREGKRAMYTPPFLVSLVGDRHCVVDCRDCTKLIGDPTTTERYFLAQQESIKRGWQFRMIGETAIRQEPLLSNVRCLTRYARVTVPDSWQAQIIGNLSDSSKTLQQVVQWLSPNVEPKHAYQAILHMVYAHQINAPIETEMLSESSHVYLGDQNGVAHIF